MLIMDSKVTTQDVLGELNERGVRFATLRMRSRSLIKHINSLASGDFKTVTLDRPGPHNKPLVHEDPAVTLTSYPGTVRQLVVTGLGRDEPTVIITNDDAIATRALITQYARRMTIEQRLAEIIRSFCADACPAPSASTSTWTSCSPSSPRRSPPRCAPGYATATPDTIQRRFLETPGQIITTPDAVTIRLDRRAFSPVLRHADLPPATPVPWWQGRTIRYEIT